MNAPIKFHEVQLESKEYREDLSSFWCPGCGHNGVLTSLLRALSEIGIAPENLMSISGIGCERSSARRICASALKTSLLTSLTRSMAP